MEMVKKSCDFKLIAGYVTDYTLLRVKVHFGKEKTVFMRREKEQR